MSTRVFATTFLTLLISLTAAALDLAHTPKHAEGTAKSEKRRYTPAGLPEGGARFPDYHRLLDHYYEVGMTEEELEDALRETMTYRLSLPQRYYQGAGYIPGVDEGWRPGDDEGFFEGRKEITEVHYWRHREEDERRYTEENGKKKEG